MTDSRGPGLHPAGAPPWPPAPVQPPLRPRRALRWWLIGGGIVVVIAVAVTTALVIGLSGESLPSNPCDMISSSTAAKYAPGASCQHDAHGQSSSGHGSGSQSTRIARWGGTIDLTATLFATSTAAQQDYTSFHGILLAADPNWTLADHRDVSGTGDRALVLYQVDNQSSDSAGAAVLVLTGKAVFRLDYFASLPSHGDAVSTPLPQGQAENNALAIARDIVDQLG